MLLFDLWNQYFYVYTPREIYLNLSVCLCPSLFIYIYIYIYVCVCVCVNSRFFYYTQIYANVCLKLYSYLKADTISSFSIFAITVLGWGRKFIWNRHKNISLPLGIHNIANRINLILPSEHKAYCMPGCNRFFFLLGFCN